MAPLAVCIILIASFATKIESTRQEPRDTNVQIAKEIGQLPEVCADLNITDSTRIPEITLKAATCDVTLRPFSYGWECSGVYPHETCVPTDARSVKKDISCRVGSSVKIASVVEADPDRKFINQACTCAFAPSKNESKGVSNEEPDNCGSLCHANAYQMFGEGLVYNFEDALKGTHKSSRAECLADLYLEASPPIFTSHPVAPPSGGYILGSSEPFGYGICKNVPFPEKTHYDILPPPKPGYCFFKNDDGSVTEFGGMCDFCICGVESDSCVYETIGSNAIVDNMETASAEHVLRSFGVKKEFYVLASVPAVAV